MNLKHATLSSVLALTACFATFEKADAQLIYGSGSSLAAKAYRSLWDCYALPVTGDGLLPSVCGTGAIVAPGAQGLYASVGSGAGKAAFNAHTAQGTTSTPATVPQFTSTYDTTYPYVAYHFTGSDDVLTATDVSTYNSAQKPALGAELQIPAFSTPVTLVFNGNDGPGGTGSALNINSANPVPIVDYDSSGNPVFDTGSYTKLNLSRQAVCGILAGHITKWNNAILTALNGGTVLGTGQITVVHRQDGSGTTFLTTNGAVSQCAAISGPNSETDSTVVSYRFPFGEIGDGLCATPTPLGANTINWPGQLSSPSSGCSPVTNPTAQGATYTGVTGSGNVKATVNSTNGAVGYLSPDFAQPIDPAGPKVANLGDGVGDAPGAGAYYMAPTAALASISISSANPPTRNALTQPLAWSRQGVVPNPDVGTYPIAGFTWLDFYQCYSSSTLSVLLNYLQFHYTNSTAQTVLGQAGFAPIPGSWFNQLGQLVVTSSSQMKTGPSVTPTACTGNAG